MRRSRINIKPNVRTGGRAVAPENKTSQESAAVDNTQQTLTEEQTNRPSPSSQPHLEVIEPAVATADGNVPDCHSEKTSVNTGDGEPSCASTPAALQRRSRISATPNLTRPKVRSVPPSTRKTSLPLVPSKSSPVVSVTAAIIRDDSQNSMFSDSLNEQTIATPKSPPSSPCLPSSSSCHEPSVQKTFTPEFPSSTQPQQDLCQTPKKSNFGLHECASPSSSTLSPYLKLSRCDGPGFPLKDSDKQQVLRALKLKELMKLERGKEKMVRKSRRRVHENSDAMDPNKMTLADFIYYLPETNPMRSSLSKEQDSAENIVPPSPKMPINLAEPEKEEDDYDDGEDGMMVPKVRVAEDGTLILDEDSLTVRVERTSDTVVENGTPLFERGSSTTYMSFRKTNHVKPWSVRETDMFYLAISMVGTDFSMMAQLLTHRTRTEIKSKFKKEEKTSAWRVDKAFRNKRTFDKEFFSFLLKRILDQDTKRGKSIKLVVKPNKAKKNKGGKKSKKHADEDEDDEDDIEDELDIGDSAFLDLEKENEDSSNVKVCDMTSSTSKKRKRKMDAKPKASPSEKTCKRRKNNNKSKKVEGEESESLHVEDDSVNAENEDSSLMPISKKKRKRSRKGEEKRSEEDLEEKRKKKRNKKTVKDLTVHDDERIDSDGENGQANMEPKSADTSKTCKRSKKCKAEKPAKGKRKTKKSKKSPEVCAEDELNTGSSDISMAGPDAEEDQGEKLITETVDQEETPQQRKKCKRPLPNLPKRKDKKCSEPKAPAEDEDAPQAQDKNCREDENELGNDSLAESQLQKQAVVILERTPPRLIKTHGWSESPDQSSQSPQVSPGRQTRAEKVKCNLTAAKRERKEMGKMDECPTGSGSDTSAEKMRIAAIPCQKDTQESKEMEEDQHIKEDFNQHHQFLTDIKGQMLLKKPAVLVSHGEVDRYLMVQTQMAVESSSSSKSQLDTASTKVKSVEEHMDGPEEKCSSGVSSEERVSQDPKMMESASSCSQQFTAQKRSRFTKPTPNLRSSQTFQRPLSIQTTESNPDSVHSNHSSTHLQSHSPVKDTMTVLNKLPDSPDEHATSSETLKEKVFQVVKDDVQTSIDDLSFSSDEETPTVSKEMFQEILSFLEKPHLATTLSDTGTSAKVSVSHSCENKDQITDVEDCDLVSETMTEEPQEELTVPSSCCKQSAEDSVVSTQHSMTTERQSRFAESMPLEQGSDIMVSAQQTTEHYEDSNEVYDKTGWQSPAKAMDCELDLSMKNISTEDKVVSCEASQQESKQAEDPLCHVQLHESEQTSSPTVPFDNIAAGNKEKSDPFINNALMEPPETCSQISADVLGASFSEAPTECLSNTCDMNTVLFCETTADNVQRSVNFSEDINSMGRTQPSNSDSVQEDSAEDLSKASEDFSAPSKGHTKSETLDSAGVETDNLTEEPTFILTLYEIPTSQLFHEVSCGHQDIRPFELQPAEVHTCLLFSENSQSPPSILEDSSALHMKAEGNEKPCRNVSEKMVDDSSFPVSEDVVKDDSTELKSSQESSFDTQSSFDLPESQEMLSYNDSMPADVASVLQLKVMPLKSTNTKAPSQRRGKIKVKPNLKPCVKAGPSKAGQKTTANVSFPTSQAIAQHAKTESNQTVSEHETVGISFHSNPQFSERETYYGYEGVLSTASLPIYEDMTVEVPMKWETDPQMDMDTVLDLSMTRLSDVPDLHSTATKESREEVEDGCGSVSQLVLVDALVLASGEMEDENRHLEDSESTRSLPTETLADFSKDPDTCREASGVASQYKTDAFISKLQKIDPKPTCAKDESSREDEADVESNQPVITVITLAPQIKEESEEEKAKQEDFSDNSKEGLGTVPTLTEEVMKTKQQFGPFTNAKTSEYDEDKHEGVSHVVLPDMFVAVSEEPKDEVHMKSKSSLQYDLQSCEDPYISAIESQQSLTTEADQETGEHEGVSHMVLPDIFIPVSEEEDDLDKETVIGGESSSCDAESSQMKEHPDTSNSLCAMSVSTNVGPSISPKRRMPIKKGMLKVKMHFPKRRNRDFARSVERSPPASAGPLSPLMAKQQNIHNLQSEKESEESEISTKNSTAFESKDMLQQSTQCFKETLICADSPWADSTDTEEMCEGVSHTVLFDILVPVLDETAESSLHKEALLVSLEDTPSENALKVEESVTEGPSTTERKNVTAILSAERNMPSCRRVTQTAQSLNPQAEEEWSLKSDMLPMDSNEIENWCEGVSHMLLSDAFVPVSEEENSTDQKGFVASGPYEEGESPLECRETPDSPNKKHQIDKISGTQKIFEKPPSSQTNKSPGRQSTFQMMLRSPERSSKHQSHVLKSTQAVPTTPQRAKTSKENKECVQTPTRQQKEEITRECTIQLERLSLEEICQHGLQPKHHSTPVNVKTFSKGDENRIITLGSHAAQEPVIPSGGWPKVVLNRLKIKGTDMDTSTSTSSPARVSIPADRSLDDYQSPDSNSGVNTDEEPALVSQFFLDDIFTEVIDPD